MITNLTVKDLQDFEVEIISKFESKQILSPIHLDSNNENELINIFKEIKPLDFKLCTWRSHYKALLAGIPKEKVIEEILKGHSISLCFPDYNFYSSAIVGTTCSLGIGLALNSKLNNLDYKTFVFLGDMASECGVAHEAIKYSINHQLPIKFIIEDNNKSVCTPTREIWGMDKLTYEDVDNEYIYHFKYESQYPHSGGLKRIQF